MNRLFWVSVGNDILKLRKKHQNEACFGIQGTGNELNADRGHEPTVLSQRRLR